MNKIIITGILCVYLFSGCENSKTSQNENKSPNPQKSVTVPSFNSDSAYYFIEQQVHFGPRVPNSEAHKLCGEFLVETLKKYGAVVIEQNFDDESFDGKSLKLKNIIGSINPEAEKRILLASHWDSRPFADKDSVDRDKPIDGANDGASGVGILLEIARTLSVHEKPEVGIDIVFFDGEDYGEHEDLEEIPRKNDLVHMWWCLGSQYWSKNPHVPRYSAYYGVLLDMAGAKNAKFYREGGSMQFAPKIVKKIWKNARDLGHSTYFINSNSPGITDDHIFVNRNAKIPMIDIVDFDPERKNYYFPKYHHTHLDNMEIIDKKTLQAVGETLMYTIYYE